MSHDGENKGPDGGQAPFKPGHIPLQPGPGSGRLSRRPPGGYQKPSHSSEPGEAPSSGPEDFLPGPSGEPSLSPPPGRSEPLLGEPPKFGQSEPQLEVPSLELPEPENFNVPSLEPPKASRPRIPELEQADLGPPPSRAPLTSRPRIPSLDDSGEVNFPTMPDLGPPPKTASPSLEPPPRPPVTPSGEPTPPTRPPLPKVQPAPGPQVSTTPRVQPAPGPQRSETEAPSQPREAPSKSRLAFEPPPDDPPLPKVDLPNKSGQTLASLPPEPRQFSPLRAGILSVLAIGGLLAWYFPAMKKLEVEPVAPVTILVSEPLAKVFAGDEPLGQTPLKLTQEHTTVILRMTGYEDKEVGLEFSETRTVKQVEELSPKLAAIDFQGVPDSAKISLNGQEAVVVDKLEKDWTLGFHQIRVEFPDQDPIEFEIEVKAGAPTELGAMVAEKLAERPRLEITVRGPEKYDLEVNKVGADSTHTTAGAGSSELILGDGRGLYTVKIVAPGFEAYEKTIEIDGPKRLTISLNRQEKTAPPPPPPAPSGGPGPTSAPRPPASPSGGATIDTPNF